MTVVARRSLRGLARLLLTPRCWSCSKPSGDALCGDCRRSLTWIDGLTCPRCGLPGSCRSRCPAAQLAFSAAWAPVAYEGPATILVRGLKERGVAQLAELMATMMVARVPPMLVPAGVVVVPVPADPWRNRRRGIDHARVLASAVARRIGIPVQTPLRRGVAGRHARQSRTGRLADRTPIHAGTAVPAAPILLVDDVHTTGATLDRAARALLDGGSGPVGALTFSRTL